MKITFSNNVGEILSSLPQVSVDTPPTKNEVSRVHYVPNKISIEKNIKQDMTFMCPECFSLIRMRDMSINYNISAFHYHKSVEFEFLPKLRLLACYCPYCPTIEDYDIELIQIDTNIAPIISKLNKKGYITKFSCEWHEGETGEPYILFENGDIANFIDYLPISWYLDYKTLKEFNSYCLRSTRPQNNSQKMEFLQDLYRFVLSLPENK